MTFFDCMLKYRPSYGTLLTRYHTIKRQSISCRQIHAFKVLCKRARKTMGIHFRYKIILLRQWYVLNRRSSRRMLRKFQFGMHFCVFANLKLAQLPYCFIQLRHEFSANAFGKECDFLLFIWMRGKTETALDISVTFFCLFYNNQIRSKLL